MTISAALDPADRQVLVNFDGRYTVFGAPNDQSRSLKFDRDLELPPYATENDQQTVAGIARSLRVSGMTSSAHADTIATSDLELIDDEGERLLVDVKMRARDPTPRDLDHVRRQLVEAEQTGRQQEVWFFNVDSLKLVVMRLDGSQLRIFELVPLDVWAQTQGRLLTRAHIIERVDDWAAQVGRLYRSVQEWLVDQPRLRIEQSRDVTILEELMLKFAVSERVVPVLDILDAEQAVATFVPRGIWVIGARGRVDLITRDRTYMLLASGEDAGFMWLLALSSDRRQTTPFDRQTLMRLLGGS